MAARKPREVTPRAGRSASSFVDPAVVAGDWQFVGGVAGPRRHDGGDDMAADAVADLLEHLAGVVSAAAVLLRARGAPMLLRAPERFTKRQAKDEMRAGIRRLLEQVDASGLTEGQKEAARRELRRADEKIATCTDEDLGQAGDILKAARRVLEALPAANPPSAADGQRREIINGIGGVETHGTLVKIKDNWESISSVATHREDGQCFLRIMVFFGRVEHARIRVKCERMDDLEQYLREMRQKLARCDYPSADDARRLWEMLFGT